MDNKDITKGYYVEFYANADGTYSVGEPMAIAEEQAEPDEKGMGESESIADLSAALKQLLNVVKSHPVGESDQAQFDAGYGASGKTPGPSDLSMPA